MSERYKNQLAKSTAPRVIDRVYKFLERSKKLLSNYFLDRPEKELLLADSSSLGYHSQLSCENNRKLLQSDISTIKIQE